jgi:cell wall-associated NlpC family hydrolase
MNYVTVYFMRRHHIGSLLLRWWMHSAYSHCALFDPATGNVIEAVVGGVRERPAEELKREASKFDEVRIPVADPQAVIDLARLQLGKPYDWRGILGFWFRRDWQDDSAFLCSEFVAWLLQAVGQPAFRCVPGRVSPAHLHMPLWDRSAPQ